jgi:hypothetical protein
MLCGSGGGRGRDPPARPGLPPGARSTTSPTWARRSRADKTAPLGFVIYWKADAHRIMRLAGDTAKGTLYLMGNHTSAERMYRYEPDVMLYAPLQIMIWDLPA